MPSIVTSISPSELAELATNQLLGLRDRLLACEDSPAHSDVTPAEAASAIDPTTIRFKDDLRWIVLYEAVKAELATREHVPGRDERRSDRQQRARAAKGDARPRKRRR